MELPPLVRHLADVTTILVLGFAYVVALTVGTAATAVHERVSSVFLPVERDQRPVEEPTDVSH